MGNENSSGGAASPLQKLVSRLLWLAPVYMICYLPFMLSVSVFASRLRAPGDALFVLCGFLTGLKVCEKTFLKEISG